MWFVLRGFGNLQLNDQNPCQNHGPMQKLESGWYSRTLDTRANLAHYKTFSWTSCCLNTFSYPQLMDTQPALISWSYAPPASGEAARQPTKPDSLVCESYHFRIRLPKKLPWHGSVQPALEFATLRAQIFKRKDIHENITQYLSQETFGTIFGASSGKV